MWTKGDVFRRGPKGAGVEEINTGSRLGEGAARLSPEEAVTYGDRSRIRHRTVQFSHGISTLECRDREQSPHVRRRDLPRPPDANGPFPDDELDSDPPVRSQDLLPDTSPDTLLPDRGSSVPADGRPAVPEDAYLYQ